MREKGKYEIIPPKHLKEELSMKIKSIVLTAALATAFSAFSDSVDIDWFTTSPDNVRYFDKAVSDPVVVTNSFRAPSISFSGYAITAYITNLVVFASTPETAELKTGAKGAICAAYDSVNSTNKWYGLKDISGTAEWHELTTETAPSEGDDYKFRMEFGASTVTYKVSTISGDTPVATSGALIRSGDANFVTNLCAFAGMGGCTNIVGEVFIDVSGNFKGVVVEDAEGVNVGKIIIDTTKLPENDANRDGANGLKNWVNYLLGLSTTKPYVAPVQNDDPYTLTFELGGVHVLGQDVTGAKVTYTVEMRSSTSGEWQTAVHNEYKSDGAQFDVEVPTGVKYYRIKIKIDPAH